MSETITTPSGHTKQFCTFRVSGRLYGVDILDIKEINPTTEFTPVSHAPETIRGYVNIRGQIYLVVDLAILLGLPASTLSVSSRVILFKPETGETFGILVDRVSDVIEVDSADIEDRRKNSNGPADGNERRQADLSSGVCKLESDLLVVLNAGSILHKIDLKNP